MSPLACKWDGAAQAFRPLRPQEAGKLYLDGQVYWLEESADRSRLSHDHQFAWLNEAWRQLPEGLMDLYPTPEHLRKRALIDCGYFRETVIDVGTRAGALRVAAYARGEDEFAHVVTRGCLVVIRCARSQRMSGSDRMTKEEFQASKTAILGKIAGLIGVEPDELLRAA